MRAALYARVSTVDKKQDLQVQLSELREYAARRGFEVVLEFVDFASGQKNGRPEYLLMFEAARKRRFEVLLVWRYDRSRCKSWSMPSRSSGRSASTSSAIARMPTPRPHRAS
jgi:DNA invertase Pin-like site-specific DNA recombinase